MSVGLVRELLRLNRIVGEDNIQAMVEGDIVVPDSKPDIARILSVRSKVKITDTEIIQGKVMVDGVVNFQVLYTCSETENNPVHSMNASASFNESIEMDGIDSTMKPEVKYVLEHSDYNVMNERKVSVKAILNLTGKVIKAQEADVVQGIQGVEDAQVLEDNIQYDVMVGNNSGQTVLRETYELAEDTPAIDEVLNVEGVPVIEEARLTDGKVIVGGNVNIKMLYGTEEPRNPVSEIKHEMPFTQFIEVPKALENMKCKVSADVENVYTEIKENLQEEKKVYDIEVVVVVKAEVYDTEEKKVIMDAYCPGRKLNLIKDNFKFLNNMSSNSSQTVIKETLDVPEDMPNVLNVFTVEANPTVTNYRVVEEKNIIEGFIDTTIVYIADTEDMEVHSFNQEIPFRHHIEMPGANDAMLTDVSTNINNVDFSKLNSKQIEIKCNLSAEGFLMEENQKDVIVDIEDLGEASDLEDKASITVYFVQKDDTIWKIAKRYNTTVKEILEANEIEDPDNIMPGQAIIIQKTYEYKL